MVRRRMFGGVKLDLGAPVPLSVLSGEIACNAVKLSL
jgi:hypothetical protein